MAVGTVEAQVVCVWLWRERRKDLLSCSRARTRYLRVLLLSLSDVKISVPLTRPSCPLFAIALYRSHSHECLMYFLRYDH